MALRNVPAMLPNFLQPTLIGLPGFTESGTGLRPGQIIHTNIQAMKNELFLLLGPNRIPLPPSTQLAAGQWVNVEIHRSEHGLQLRVTPETARGSAAPQDSAGALRPGASGPGPAAPNVGATYTPDAGRGGVRVEPGNAALPQAPAAGQTVPAAPPLTPQGVADASIAGQRAIAVPATGPVQNDAVTQLLVGLAGSVQTGLGVEALRALAPPVLLPQPVLLSQLLSLWRPADGMKQDMAVVAGLVREGVQQGVLPESLAQAASQVFAPVSAQVPPVLAEAMNMMGRALPWEARLALLLSGGRAAGAELAAAFQDDGRTLQQLIRNHPDFLAFLRERGQEKTFFKAADGLQERLTAGQLQNVRSHEAPYLFLNLPLPQEEGFERAMIHFFDEGRHENRRFHKEGAMIALDLSLSAVGQVWITLHFSEQLCKCRILVEDRESLALFQSQAEDLARQLERSQELKPQISVEQWDGDHVRETANLMARFQGLDVSG